MSRTNATRVLAAALASLAVAAAAHAQPSDRWEITLAPYVMGAAIDGTVAVNGRDAVVDVTADDIFDHMDLGFMGMAAARKGNWGVVADAVLVKLDVDSQMPPGAFKPTIGLLSVQGVRRLTDYADVTAGVRWNHLDADIDIQAPVAAHIEKSRDWFDPVVGVVLRTPAKGRLHATLIADVGGFGAGSELTWQVFPTVGIQLSKRASFEAGYRWLDVDYETGEGPTAFEYDVRYQGPVVGFTFKF